VEGSLGALLFVLFQLQEIIGGWLFPKSVKNSRPFMGGGRVGLGWSHAHAHPSVIGPEGATTMSQRLGSPAKGIGGAVFDLSGFRAFDQTADDAVVGTESHPRGEVFDGGKLRRIQADLGEDRLHSQGLYAFDLGKIRAADAIEMGAQIEVGMIASRLFPPRSGRRQRRLLGIDPRLQTAQIAFDLLVALGDLLLVKAIGLHRLR